MASAAPTGSTVAPSRWLSVARARPVLVDLAGAAVLSGISFPGTAVSLPGLAAPGRLPGILLSGLACASLLGHRRYPRATAVVAVACAVTLAALGYVLTPLLLAPAMVALFSLAYRASRATAYTFALAATAAVLCASLATGTDHSHLAFQVFGPEAWLLLPAPLGVAARERGQYVRRAREEEARRRVTEERLRIARELHDVVAHHLALANAQAGTAAHLIAAQPLQAQKIADELAGTVSAALRELKATVGLLREPAASDPPLEPLPGLARLPELAASFRAAGLAVVVETEGTPQQASPTVDLTAFRIIQEALTNASKHAATRRASVRLRYAGDWLTVTITNDAAGTGPAPKDTPGFGLTGMVERAASVGGSLRAGHRPAGGFEVAAELPLRAGEPHEVTQQATEAAR